MSSKTRRLAAEPPPNLAAFRLARRGTEAGSEPSPRFSELVVIDA
jgi:hypothetical protein